MKTRTRCYLNLSAIPLFGLSAVGQGSLTPPGAPSQTMKTLDQIEARTPISAGTNPFTIAAAGSYYLTGNLSISAGNGITVNVSNVIIDLNGFALVGTNPASGAGIFIGGGVSNVTIRNGTIHDWGSYGINGAGNSKVRAADLRVLNNGSTGIRVDVNGAVLNCVAESNAGPGIQGADNCIINDCQSTSNTAGGAGISVGNSSVVSGCIARSNSGDGFDLGADSAVSGCIAGANSGNGINASDRSMVTACTASMNSLIGVRVTTNCLVRGCNIIGNGNGGVYVSGGKTVIDGNNAAFNGFSDISTNPPTGENVIVRNVITNSIQSVPSDIVGEQDSSNVELNTNKNPHANIAH